MNRLTFESKYLKANRYGDCPWSQSAKDGYRSYLHAYAAHSLRSVFDVNALDLVKVAKSFGFAMPPRVDITLGASMSRDKKIEGRRTYGSQPKQASRFKRKRFED